jgi:hypothetical protein
LDQGGVIYIQEIICLKVMKTQGKGEYAEKEVEKEVEKKKETMNETEAILNYQNSIH